MLLRPSSPLLTWLLGLALLLSVGFNLHGLTLPPNQLALARTMDDDNDDEEGDTAWAALQEQLRQTRQQLAECQARPGATGRGQPHR